MHAPPVNRMTNWCKNITLPQTSFAGGKYRSVIQCIMSDGPIIQRITIDTMLNNNGLNIGDGLNFVTCEQTLMVAVAKLGTYYFLLPPSLV